MGGVYDEGIEGDLFNSDPCRSFELGIMGLFSV
jgi:hypothetical protein